MSKINTQRWLALLENISEKPTEYENWTYQIKGCLAESLSEDCVPTNWHLNMLFMDILLTYDPSLFKIEFLYPSPILQL